MQETKKRGTRCKHGIYWPYECKDCLYEDHLAEDKREFDRERMRGLNQSEGRGE